MPQDPNNIADLLSDQAKDTLKEEKASEVPPQDFIPKSKEDSVPENHGDVVIKPKNTPQSESKKESGGKRLKKKNVLQLLFH
ncbi:hypothetical protein HON22_05790, partial [Candidatus Peregrinibacteria bacterium]|nr:hypothetical protein [Candidatus Peregrinibacteria bacterium]